MSASEPILADGALLTAAESSAATGWWDRLEVWLGRVGDRLNPILVKEARQALKSKQFVLTFALVLLAAWFWSVGGVLWLGPEAHYRTGGQEMFFGYFLILAFPLTVVVPFGAFQSLAAEREDRTFELVSISTLRPWQIVSGKLGSAMLQMLVYLSAVSPCLAFTYMLRGIDILTILMMIGYVVLASLGFSALALLLATLTTEKHWQVVLSVLLILGLMYCFMGGMALASQVTGTVWPFDESAFWVANAALVTAFASYFALAIVAAAAQLSFASDNRATALRVIMLAQQGLWIGWMAILVRLWGEPGPRFSSLYPLVAVPLLQWSVAGALMAGESPHLSRRVQRSLPQSFLGRVFLTWFNPGPGTGYVFTVANLCTVWLAAMIGMFIAGQAGWSTFAFLAQGFPPNTGAPAETVFYFITLGVCYSAFYLGLGTLLVRLARHFAPTTLFLSLLVNLLLVLAGTALPVVIQYSADPPIRDYTLWQALNPFWTLLELPSNRGARAEAPALLAIVGTAALVVFAANLVGVIREVRFVRVEKPKRVAQEDAEEQAQHAPPAPVRKSPWD